MSDTSIDSIAAQLTTARKEGKQIEPPAIESEADAYAVQMSVCLAAGGVGAWKIGAVPPDNAIRSSPIAASSLRKSETVFPSGSFCMVGIEAEVAFVMGRGFRASEGMPSERQIDQGIARVCAAIEIVDTRISNWRRAPALALLADSLCNGALVVGAELDDWRGRNLSAPGFEIVVDGRVAVGPGSNVVKQPLGLLRVLLSHCAHRRIDLPPGLVVTTGSSTGMHFIEPPSIVELRQADQILVSARFE